MPIKKLTQGYVFRKPWVRIKIILEFCYVYNQDYFTTGSPIILIGAGAIIDGVQ